MSESKIFKPAGYMPGDPIYENLGPINPVANHQVAWNMALAEDRVRHSYQVSLEVQKSRQDFGMSELSYRAHKKRLKDPLDVQLDKASERSRIATAVHDIIMANEVYVLREITPDSESIQNP